jgi:RNA polymerase sigma factor (sigma-70 family)
MSALLEPPGSEQVQPDGLISDHKLVAAVRRGDDRAFEGLYERYHRRIHAYVFGMVKDHQRAEDVTQEVFVSALRRMRATERPIAFKPWIYEIAKNACIDQFRRSRRAEEVSYDADDGLAPGDYGRLVSREPVPDAAFAAKQQLDDLCGAFGGLSDAHHEILVLRELEGLSYREIGERMGMSRPAVESTLFRARRRLSEEYDELASGQRCLRIQSIIAGAGSGRLGARDTRRLARHVAHCQPCRRQAMAAGVDAALVARKPLRQRAVEKVAALFPFPLLLRGRREGGGGGSGDSWLSQLPVMSDHAAAGGTKLAAVAALVVAGLGAGVGTHVVPVGGSDSSGGAVARPAKSVTKPRIAKPAHGITIPAKVTPARSGKAGAKRRSSARTRVGHEVTRSLGGSGGRSGSGASSPAASGGRSGGAGGTGVNSPPSGGKVPASLPDTSSAPSTPSTGGGSGPPSIQIQVPSLDPGSSAPTNTIDTGQAVQQVTGTVQETTQGVTDAVQDTTDTVTETTQGALDGLGG